MSISPDFSETSRFQGHRPTRVAEKSNFSQTCNLLSQYLKENGGFGDLKLTPEMKDVSVSRDLKSMDLFPQHSGFESSPSPPAETVTNKEVQNPQMTIFYGGKVLVFDHLSADKVKQVMLLASKASSVPEKTPINFVTPPSTTTHYSTALAQPRQSHISGLPIARKASLHRFLEKRKDRILAKAPYTIIYSSASTSAKLTEAKKEWLGWTGQPPKTLEFQL
ncbi:hypothetical protein GIB67_026546 [Kingdonia uniflora]|uniref:Protein TIFY n=1 Tax=Kingdonia uniflora TaxID=39325 RepID=A0A7J7PBQ9_9MAGN|nr:hypothetical protein GIB67_026546 [Kingdonia uniflora]